jgi:hypothetical protein
MDARDHVLPTRHFEAAGDRARLTAAVRDETVRRVHRGAYVSAEAWDTGRPEDRMRLAAHAHALTTRQPPIFSFVTAAALHGLPVNRREDERVHTSDPAARPASTRGSIVRHHGPLSAADIVEIDGLRVTSLARTVFDVIRLERREVGIAVFDAALRALAWRGAGAYDETAADAFRRDVRDRVDAASGMRGVRAARFLTDFADGRAQLPGESVSRLWMHLLGVPAPELQLTVLLDSGRAFPDFAWPRLRRFGEFDGDGKYVDLALTRGRSVREVLRAQREREGAIIAATGWLPVRWGSERLASLSGFAAFLRQNGLLS